MSKIAILGAGGRLGTRLVTEALGQALRVNALTRDPGKLHFANDNFNVFKGNVETGEGLGPALAGCRWVVTSLSSTHPSECVSHLVKTLSSRPVDRLLFVARADGTVPAHGLSKFSSLVGHKKQDVAHDLTSALELLEVSGMPFTVLRTDSITDGPGGHPVVASEGRQAPGKVSRIDLARFILSVLHLPEWNLRDAQVGSAR